MRRGAAAVVAAALGGWLAGGCTVGSGAGHVTGKIFEYGCLQVPGSDEPVDYNLNPTYWAGIPIEDLSVTGMHTNEMQIRMQNNGLAINYADTLFFDVLNSYEVARCVRGAVDKETGRPLYNVTEPLPDGGSTLWCDWSGMAVTDGGIVDAGLITPGAPDSGTPLDGGMSVTATSPRIRVTPYTDVRSSFTTLSTCGITNVVGVAFDGWISFQDFGGAAQPNYPPNARMPVPTDFVIQFGDRMRAVFDIILGDQIIITSRESNVPPTRQPEINGNLHGSFDFNLERGRSAQPFP